MTANGIEVGLFRLGDTHDILGEVPVWSVAEQALCWVDVRGPCIRRRDWNSGQVASLKMPELVGCIALRAGRPRLIVGLRTVGGVVRSRDRQRWSAFPPRMPTRRAMRFNDGKCDRQGRFWVGSMDDVGRGPVGTLYRFEAGSSRRCSRASPFPTAWPGRPTAPPCISPTASSR